VLLADFVVPAPGLRTEKEQQLLEQAHPIGVDFLLPFLTKMELASVAFFEAAEQGPRAVEERTKKRFKRDEGAPVMRASASYKLVVNLAVKSETLIVLDASLLAVLV
jgi:hypothetical protein